VVNLWRYIDSGLIDGPTSQAIDEVILQARLKGMVPNTLHQYRRKPPAISVGRYQNIEEVADLNYCRKQGIDLIRRVSGGGTIYTDSNCLEYAIIVDQQYPEIPMSLEGSFKVICAGIIIALKQLGIEATYKPINDVLVGGRKISGSAQRRRRILLQHGTLLMDADFVSMSQALKIGSTTELMTKLTTIRREAPQEYSVEEVQEALKTGFEESLSMKVVNNRLIPWEKEKIRALVDKYRSLSWIFPDLK
jgi:lipoate-protein ligase A